MLLFQRGWFPYKREKGNLNIRDFIVVVRIMISFCIIQLPYSIYPYILLCCSRGIYWCKTHDFVQRVYVMVMCTVYNTHSVLFIQ